MAKKVTGFVKLQIPAGKANPAPPVGTALGPQGINIMAFCKEFKTPKSPQPGHQRTSWSDTKSAFFICPGGGATLPETAEPTSLSAENDVSERDRFPLPVELIPTPSNYSRMLFV